LRKIQRAQRKIKVKRMMIVKMAMKKRSFPPLIWSGSFSGCVSKVQSNVLKLLWFDMRDGCGGFGEVAAVVTAEK
jgi:hypothetical protein